MKRFLISFIALFAVLAIALPSFALEMKYGGLYRARLHSDDNVSDGNSDRDDNDNYIDQRLRMYFTFVSSENLQLVTRWEADTVWGRESTASGTFTVPAGGLAGGSTVTVPVGGQAAGRHGGGDVGADATNLEMKNIYLDFAIPNTPVRSKIGVQGIQLMSGWVVDDDFSAAVFDTNFNPVTVKLGYIAAQNQNVTDESENVDDFFGSVTYAQGPFKASLVAFWQNAHNTTASVDPGLNGNATNIESNAANGAHFAKTFTALGVNTGFPIEDNNLFDLGLNFEYKESLWSAYVNFVKNFGSFDLPGVANSNFDQDYSGWMIEAAGNLYCGPFTFTLGGFYTSGSDIQDVAENFGDYFKYPAGVSHYWSEIMSPGVLDVSVAGEDRNRFQFGYASADHPSNLWMVNVGAAWQILEGTKATLNYYYIGTSGDVISGAHIDNLGNVVIDTDTSIGHELDFYLDQKIVDKLSIKLVAAYLFANEGYTTFNDDDDAYKLGAQLLWAF